MRLRLRRQGNDRGEWSVLDLARGYRICRYNDHHHGGTHIHFPETGDAADLVDVSSAAEAESLLRAYHDAHDHFDPDRFQEVYRRWRSASDAD